MVDWISVACLFAGFGIGIAFTVSLGIYHGMKAFATTFAQTEAEIKQHNAELQTRNKAGCRRTTGNI